MAARTTNAPDEIKGIPVHVNRQALESGFHGLDQVQIHLNGELKQSGVWPYEIEADFLAYALVEPGWRGIDLQVLPFNFDQSSMNRLMDLGIRWYATDEPSRFLECVNGWKA